MPFRLPKAVLFDLDGTLLDSLPGIRHSAESAFAACGLAINSAELRTLIGPPIRVILSRMGTALTDADLDALERAFRTSYDSEGWQMTPHYPGAAEALRSMQAQGARLFVVSNKPRHISLRILEAEGTCSLFEEIVTRDTRTPPYAGKPEMIAYLLQKWELPPGVCMMIGDTMEDAKAASNAGLPFCLMTHGYGHVPPNSPVPVAFRFDRFSELLDDSHTQE